MRVKIGNTWHDAKKVPMCFELTPHDKQLIRDMAKGATKIAFVEQDDISNQAIFDWMDDKLEI